ncbi:uncharacterized protein VDAG_01332 [Verticillium dahliae VdLs.17]|uniref:Uncharacterized protein n=2 Tax=Verticillium dahliae TaxID=27337 RepID=G2WU59_VERDV|nr:uncharacterized protein VDAG_01332 [Verticillium dahliae VdLs.17]EGY17650.1 hypothetical protein VDAG_01332 [Verticillium dahliae VdLs.17]KAH6690882.1 hypothetical protein EV126DRAFT_391110 [Verticillium dahliae]
MTRLGPLTAQALGRSPFDDLVEGEVDAEDESGEHTQQYDSRGRPHNNSTRRMNRDMIRAHNEVMQVIGVAEPDNVPTEADLESVRRYVDYEETMGHRLLRIGRTLEVGGVWGVNGLRARILLYKRYADISFFDLFRYEKSQRSMSNLFLAGLPTFLAGHALKLGSHQWAPARARKRWLNPLLSYIRVHLQLYVFMQRTDIIPASKWFPSWTYFIPGFPSSPIPAPEPPKDLTAASLVQYMGAWCINALPFASFVLWVRLWTRVTTYMWQEFYARLPNTVHHRRHLPPPPPPQAAPPSPPVVDAQPPPPRQPVDLPPQNRAELLRDIVAQVASESTTPPDPPPSQPLRRPSAFSTRGDDFGSDDEEEGGISAPLISFDVEATDSTDAPPGLWSAELRPSAGPEGSPYGLAALHPTYVDTMLTRLPACLASDIFTVISAYVIVAPYEAMALRLVARAYRERMGLPVFDIHEWNIFSGLTWRSVTNFVGLEFVHLIIAGELWAMISSLSQLFHMTEEEWKEFEEMRRAEVQREREAIQRTEP